jgi:hypothetical protein
MVIGIPGAAGKKNDHGFGIKKGVFIIATGLSY